MLALTAFDINHRSLGAICIDSMIRYCSKFPGNLYDCQFIRADYARPCSWAKVNAIRSRLAGGYDHVLWVDADTLITGAQNLDNLIDPCADLNISIDENGINCGVMVWKGSERTLKFLAEVDADTKYADHVWWEQAAINERLNELNVHFVPKTLFNAYPDDANAQSGVLHWPGMSVEERLPLMQEAFTQAWER